MPARVPRISPAASSLAPPVFALDAQRAHRPAHLPARAVNLIGTVDLTDHPPPFAARLSVLMPAIHASWRKGRAASC